MKIIDLEKNIKKYKSLYDFLLVEHGVDLELNTITKCERIDNKIEITYRKATLEDIIKNNLEEKERIKQRLCKKYGISLKEYQDIEKEYKALSKDYFFCRKNDYYKFLMKNYQKTRITNPKKFRYFRYLTLENYIKVIKDRNFDIRTVKSKEGN